MSVPTIRLQGLVYRAHNPRWSFLPTSGDGAARHGGRFNPPGVPALYTSRRPEMAWLEAQQAFPFKPQPLTLCAYQVDCRDIVDLTDMTAREAEDASHDDLACPWEYLANSGETPPTWILSHRLIDMGYAGIVVPSFAARASGRDVNVVFWRWSDDPPHRVCVIDDENRLPRNPRSWQ